jgi:FixJ family two-component response regulator
MSTLRPLVSVVDDDESVRESLPDLLKELGFDVQAFSSAEEFLAAGAVERTECLIMDVAMPGMTGPELQVELIARGLRTPIVFITAYVDEVVRETVIRRGAVDCLFKPFTEAGLMGALNVALRRLPR